VRGRAGLVVDRALVYATAGVAFVDIDDYAHSLTTGCSTRGCYSVTGVQTGLAAGFGAEYALWGAWSAKGEYLYVTLPTKNTHDLVRTGTFDTYNVKSDAHIVRLGLNYHLNGGLPATSAAFAMASAGPVANWTGFYIGGVAGGALQNTIMDDKDCNLSCSSQNLNGSGFTGGVTGGWNYQFGSGVVGIEGDFNWAHFKGSFTDPQWSNPNGTIHSAEWKSFSTVRGRAGLAVGQTLIYATGGVAFVDIDDFAHSLTTGCSTRGCFSVTGWQTGLAAGAGAEYAFWGPWSAKAEYLYVGLPTKNTHDLVLVPTFNTYNVKSDAHIVRLGLNYHFR
jgi:opacity protein-like surface antigen